jgi:hypothetical protein
MASDGNLGIDRLLVFGSCLEALKPGLQGLVEQALHGGRVRLDWITGE